MIGLQGKSYSISKWTEEEDAILREYYPIGGYPLCIEKGIVHRTPSSIKIRASAFGIRFKVIYLESKVRGKWTNKDKNILLEYFKTEGIRGVRSRGVNKSPVVIYKEALDLGLVDGSLI